jgi:hypothetical protein
MLQGSAILGTSRACSAFSGKKPRRQMWLQVLAHNAQRLRQR